METDVYLGILQNEINQTKKRIDVSKEKVAELEQNILRKENIKKVLEKVLFIKKQEMKVLEDTVNKGLRYVFDEDLNFEIKFVSKNNRVVPEFFLNGEVLKPPLFIGEAGGKVSVIGMILFLLYVKIKNKKIILMDESDSMVDIEATRKLFEFLDYFTKENDINLMCISHKVLEDMEMDSFELINKININFFQ